MTDANPVDLPQNELDPLEIMTFFCFMTLPAAERSTFPVEKHYGITWLLRKSQENFKEGVELFFTKYVGESWKDTDSVRQFIFSLHRERSAADLITHQENWKRLTHDNFLRMYNHARESGDVKMLEKARSRIIDILPARLAKEE